MQGCICVLRLQPHARDASRQEIPSNASAETSRCISLVADKAWQAFQESLFNPGGVNALSPSTISVLIEAETSGSVGQG